MSVKEVIWPGYAKEDGGFFAMHTGVISGMFEDSDNERSKRIGKMLANLSVAMIEDGKAYFDMFHALGEFYGELATDWNQIYTSRGGEMGSGSHMLTEISVEDEFYALANQYKPDAFSQFQACLPALQDVQSQLSESDPKEHERLGIIRVFYSSIFNAMMLQDKWFDRVEKALNDNAPALTEENQKLLDLMRAFGNDPK
jgi:hypothetical protein